jgi:hypothetical protein
MSGLSHQPNERPFSTHKSGGHGAGGGSHRALLGPGAGDGTQSDTGLGFAVVRGRLGKLRELVVE